MMRLLRITTNDPFLNHYVEWLSGVTK